MARGRKRKLTARQPNGQPKRSRPEMQEAAALTAKQARARHHGVPLKEAADPHLATAVGRLYRASAITREQYDDGVRYIRLHASYRAAIDVPGRVVEPRSEDEPAKPCEDCGATIRCEPCAAEWSDRVRAQWAALNASLSRYEQVVAEIVLIEEWDQPAGLVAAVLDKIGAYFGRRMAA